MTWADRSEALAEEARELGQDIAGIHAAAWRARVDPDATGGLAGAATALWAPTTALFSRGKPMPSDRVMAGQTEDREIEAGELFRAAGQLRTGATSALAAAGAALAAAMEAGRNARTDAERAGAARQEAAARAAMADCEVALEILGEVMSRLGYAIGSLQRVPEDLAETYEAAYRLLDAGGRLPRDTDFLTGTIHPSGDSSHALAG